MSFSTHFINCRQCIHGTLVAAPLTVDSNGLIIPSSPLPQNITIIDLENAIVSPGFMELQINGALGFHFAHYTDAESYIAGVLKIAKHLPSTGVTAFYPTIPTVSPTVFQATLPFLKPQSLSTSSATILGTHVEGPFLNPSKKGAHDASNLHTPSSTSLGTIYDVSNLKTSIELLTLAPELPGALEHIRTLATSYAIRVSLGHSDATLAEGEAGLAAGATLLTHTFNAMSPLHHREPGLAGLISLAKPPYFTIIADGIHLHPRVVALAYRASPSHCVLTTDSIELSGLPDGVYPGHAQIPGRQVKQGNKVTIEGSETLVGTCIGLDECVRNLMTWTEIRLEEAVMCVTENVAGVMGLRDRGILEVGRKADFLVLNEEGMVRETWIAANRVYQRGDEGHADA